MKPKYKLRTALLLISVLTLASCESSDSYSDIGAESGKGGSTARFAIAGDVLYTVSFSDLKAFDISAPASPILEGETYLWSSAETIFGRGNTLFVGTQWGMEIYDVSEPLSPQKISEVSHIFSCDPVVVEGDYAFVTLHSMDNFCGQSTNELQVIDISNLYEPKLVKTYPMTSPRGLGIDNGTLFICDEGLKVFDAADVNNITLEEHFKIKADDVIAYNDLLIVTGEEGIYQYDYSGGQLTLLSTISIAKK